MAEPSPATTVECIVCLGLNTRNSTMSSTLEKHTTGPQLLIARKKVILKNDCIHYIVDIYHI